MLHESYALRHQMNAKILLPYPKIAIDSFIQENWEEFDEFFKGEDFLRYDFYPSLIHGINLNRGLSESLIEKIICHTFPYKLLGSEKALALNIFFENELILKEYTLKNRDPFMWWDILAYLAYELDRSPWVSSKIGFYELFYRIFKPVLEGLSEKLANLTSAHMSMSLFSDYYTNYNNILNTLSKLNLNLDADIYILRGLLMYALDEEDFVLADILTNLGAISTFSASELIDYIHSEAERYQTDCTGIEYVPENLSSVYLIEHGVNFNGCVQSQSPLDASIKYNHLRVLDLLRRKKAKPGMEIKAEAIKVVEKKVQEIWGLSPKQICWQN